MPLNDEIFQLLSEANNSNLGPNSLRTLDKAIYLCENNSNQVDTNLYCKVRILKGDLLLKSGDYENAIEEYKKASYLDEMDGKIDSPELKEKLNSVINSVSHNLQKNVNESSSSSNERDISSLLLNQISNSSNSNYSKLSMLSTLLSSTSNNSSKPSSGFLSLVQHLSSNGVNANQQKQSGGFNVASLMQLASTSGLISGNNHTSQTTGSLGSIATILTGVSRLSGQGSSSTGGFANTASQEHFNNSNVQNNANQYGTQHNGNTGYYGAQHNQQQMADGQEQNFMQQNNYFPQVTGDSNTTNGGNSGLSSLVTMAENYMTNHSGNQSGYNNHDEDTQQQYHQNVGGISSLSSIAPNYMNNNTNHQPSYTDSQSYGSHQTYNRYDYSNNQDYGSQQQSNFPTNNGGGNNNLGSLAVMAESYLENHNGNSHQQQNGDNNQSNTENLLNLASKFFK